MVHIAKIGVGKVAYFRPLAKMDYVAQLVVADAQSGRDLAVPVSAAFPHGLSSDYGWTWHLFADQHVVVGSVYGLAGHEISRPCRRDG